MKPNSASNWVPRLVANAQEYIVNARSGSLICFTSRHESGYISGYNAAGLKQDLYSDIIKRAPAQKKYVTYGSEVSIFELVESLRKLSKPIQKFEHVHDTEAVFADDG